jgi:PTH1 family peptidyl-tRNA hydrolase
MSESVPWVVVGLGNPGRKYEGNRHNVGFGVVDAWTQTHLAPQSVGWRQQFSALTTVVHGSFGKAVVLKPQTYMNRSGHSVAPAVQFFQVPLERLVVVHDELDFEFGRIAVKSGGGHGGNNGLRDIIARLGAREFVRIRVGVGRPQRGDVSSWLLSDFDGEERAQLPEIIERAGEALTTVVAEGVPVAMNRFNAI